MATKPAQALAGQVRGLGFREQDTPCSEVPSNQERSKRPSWGLKPNGADLYAKEICLLIQKIRDKEKRAHCVSIKSV